jgi:hypothetical protein
MPVGEQWKQPEDYELNHSVKVEEAVKSAMQQLKKQWMPAESRKHSKKQQKERYKLEGSPLKEGLTS